MRLPHHVRVQTETLRLYVELTFGCCMQHPGFDFSGAKFSGQAPNPRTFMGGISEK